MAMEQGSGEPGQRRGVRGLRQGASTLGGGVLLRHIAGVIPSATTSRVISATGQEASPRDDLAQFHVGAFSLSALEMVVWTRVFERPVV